MLYIDVFTARDKGNSHGLNLADKLRDMFRRETVGCVNFNQVEIKEINNKTDPFYHVQVICYFFNIVN